MKGRGSRGVRGGGWWQRDAARVNFGGDIWLGGGKRTFRKRTCRSKSRCGDSSWSSSKHFFLGGRRSRGVRGVRRVRRSRRSRRGGRLEWRGERDIIVADLDSHFGGRRSRGVRGVRRSRRGGWGEGRDTDSFLGHNRGGGSRGVRGVRGVRRSRRGGRGGAYGVGFLNDSGLPRHTLFN